MGIIAKGIRAVQKARVQRKLKPKSSKPRKQRTDSQNIKMHGAPTKVRQQRKVQEAQKLAKGADRSKKTEQVAKRVLPDVGSKVRKELQGMSAAEIANAYTGTQITAMMRKIKNPKVLAKLARAKRGRTRQGKKFIEQHQGVHHEGYPPVPRKGSRGAEISAKAFKRGGVAKRKSGGSIGMGAALRGGGAVRRK